MSAATIIMLALRLQQVLTHPVLCIYANMHALTVDTVQRLRAVNCTARLTESEESSSGSRTNACELRLSLYYSAQLTNTAIAQGVE